MDQNTEFLNYIYQNSEMGKETIARLEKKVEDPVFLQQLHAQLNEYETINEQAAAKLHEGGEEEKSLPKMAEIMTYMSIEGKTLADRSTQHIAEMMMQGSMMGIIDITKNIKKYPNAQPESKQLAEKLLKTEQSNIENLKSFL